MLKYAVDWSIKLQYLSTLTNPSKERAQRIVQPDPARKINRLILSVVVRCVTGSKILHISLD